MIGCPACGTWLHEECIVEDIKARVVARGGGPPKAAEEQSEEDASAEETISVTKAPLKRKSGAKGKSLFQSAVDKYTDESSTPTKSETPAPATPATNGKSGRRKNKAELKTKASDLEKLEVMYNEGSTKVHVRDLRGVKKAKANRAKKGMQGEGGGGEEGVVEWDEDVVCLCCGADIE